VAHTASVDQQSAEVFDLNTQAALLRLMTIQPKKLLLCGIN
jgi:hypothetical protein